MVLVAVGVAPALALLPGCKQPQRRPIAVDAAVGQPPAPSFDPEVEYAAIARLQTSLAEAEKTRAFAETTQLVASPLIVLACGVALAEPHQRVAAGVLADELPRRGAAVQSTALTLDGKAAWSVSSGDAGALLDLFERRATGWVLVASVRSAEAEDHSASCAWARPAAPPALERASGADADAIRKLRAADWASGGSPGRAAGFSGEATSALWCGRLLEGDGLHDDLRDLTLDAAPPERGLWLATSGGLGAVIEGWAGQAVDDDDSPAHAIAGVRLVALERRGPGWFVVAQADSFDAAAHKHLCQAPPRRIVVTDTTIEILDKVYFASGAVDVAPISFPIVDAVAATLIGNPDISKIAVKGHADKFETGDVDALSLTRARKVTDYLIGKGVRADRLVPTGLGTSQPAGTGRGVAARAANRRVEFMFINPNP